MSTANDRFDAYDPFAVAYAELFDRAFAPSAWAALERLVLEGLPAGAAVVDLCCGTGALVRRLGDAGFRVTGVDGSGEMLRVARTRNPDACFVHADARDFSVAEPCALVASTFDSLNHLMSEDDLARAIACAHRALMPGGVFVFDLNVEEGFLARWRETSAIVEERRVVLLRFDYQREARIGDCRITLFDAESPGRAWVRRDLHLVQRCHEPSDVQRLLCEAGFVDVTTHAAVDLGLRDVGRTFFVARRRAAPQEG